MMTQTIGRLKTATKKILGSKQDLFDLLRTDHVRVESLLFRLRVSRSNERREFLLRQLRQALDKHMKIEEEILYPACEKAAKLKALVEDSYDEHKKAKSILRELGSMTGGVSRFRHNVTRLISVLEIHVLDEEENLFPALQKEMRPRDFNRLNREIIAAFAAIPRAKAKKAA